MKAEPLKAVNITPTDSTHFRRIDSIKAMATGIEQRKESVQAIIKPQPQPPTSKQESSIRQADVQIHKLAPFPHGAEPYYTEPDSDAQTQANKSEFSTYQKTHMRYIEGQTCRLATTHEQYTSKSDSSVSNPDLTGLMEEHQLPACEPQPAATHLLKDKLDRSCNRKGKLKY